MRLCFRLVLGFYVFAFILNFSTASSRQFLPWLWNVVPDSSSQSNDVCHPLAQSWEIFLQSILWCRFCVLLSAIGEFYH